jgi:hypothetical protein
VFDVDERDPTARDAFDVYDQRLQPIQAAEALIDAESSGEALPPWRFEQRPILRWYELRVQYWIPRQMLNEFGREDKEQLISEAQEQRKIRQYCFGTHYWRNVINCVFLSSVSLFSSLLYTLLLYWISAQYKCRSHGFYHFRISVNGRWSFTVGRIHQKATLWCQSVAGHLSLYEYIPGMIV